MQQQPDWFGGSADDAEYQYFDSSGEAATEVESIQRAKDTARHDAISFVLVNVRSRFDLIQRAHVSNDLEQFESQVRATTSVEAQGPLRHAKVVRQATSRGTGGAVAYVRLQVPRKELQVTPEWFVGCAQAATGEARILLLRHGRYLFPDHAGLRSQLIDELEEDRQWDAALDLAGEAWHGERSAENAMRVRAIANAWLNFAEQRESLSEFRRASTSVRSVGVDGLDSADLDARLVSLLLKEADRQHRLGDVLQARQLLTEALAVAKADTVHEEIQRRIEDLRAGGPGTSTSAAPTAPDLDGFLYRGRIEAGTFLYEHAGSGIEFVLVPGGRFTRSDGVTTQEVSLSPYLIGRYEITRAQWQRVMGEAPEEGVEIDLPVSGITWTRALEFCRRAELELPSEAQWEYACRAGGDEPGERERLELGWHASNSEEGVHAIGTKQPNAWGLYDMYGNLWEWCRDCLVPYQGRSVADPVGSGDDRTHVLRGGSFSRYGSNCGASERHAGSSTAPPSRTIGLRMVKPLRSDHDGTLRGVTGWQRRWWRAAGGGRSNVLTECAQDQRTASGRGWLGGVAMASWLVLGACATEDPEYGTRSQDVLVNLSGAYSFTDRSFGTTSEGIELPSQEQETFSGQTSLGYFLTAHHEIGAFLYGSLTRIDHAGDSHILFAGPYYNLNLYPTETLSVYLGPHAGITNFDSAVDSATEFSYGAHAGLRFWVTPRAAFTIEPRGTWTEFDNEIGGDTFTLDVLVGFSVRF
ncbi:MAG: SUMF1/EgtB/PvdO family nonheme iron enzyme [Planctomycetota bacterium]